MSPRRLVNAQLVEQAAELPPVLGHIDALRASAEDTDARPGQPQGQVVGYLPAQADDDGLGTLALPQVQHALEAHFTENQPVAFVPVGADCFRVVVEHNGLVPELGRRPDPTDAAPVELHARADPVGPRPQHQDLLTGARRALVLSGEIGRIQIVGLGRKLRRKGIDARKLRDDPVFLSDRTHLLARRHQSAELWWRPRSRDAWPAGAGRARSRWPLTLGARRPVRRACGRSRRSRGGTRYRCPSGREFPAGSPPPQGPARWRTPEATWARGAPPSRRLR